MWWAASGVVDTPGASDLGVFANYGILGVLALILIGFAFKAFQRESTRADRLENELRDKNAVIQDKVIPALVAASDAVQESQRLVREMAAERDRELNRLTVRGRDQ